MLTAAQIKTMKPEELAAAFAAQAAALAAAQARNNGKLSLKIGEKGGVSLCGMGRFPVTLYGSQWERLIEFVPHISEFINANRAKLKWKE